MILTRILFTLVSALFFLFFFWRRLKEDYVASQVFTTGFYILMGFAIGNIISDNFVQGWWFWLGFGFGTLGLVTGVMRFRLRIFEALEASVLASLLLLASIFLYDFLINGNNSSIFGLATLLILIISFFLIDRHYKSFTWYKSGRVGFTGMSLLGAFFLIRTIVAILELPVLSFVGEKEIIISGALAFTSFLVVFNLSRSLE